MIATAKDTLFQLLCYNDVYGSRMPCKKAAVVDNL